MPLSNSDLFVVQRGDKLFKVKSEQLKETYNSEAQVFVGPTPPTDPVEGTLWWSTLEGNLFIWYDDGDSEQWVDASPAFVEIDYTRIEDYIDQSVRDNAVSQIVPGDNISILPGNGKGVVTINAVVPEVDLTPYVLVTDFEKDQDRQDDLILALEEKHDKEIAQLNNIIQNLIEDIEDIKQCVFSGLNYLDGGNDQAPSYPIDVEVVDNTGNSVNQDPSAITTTIDGGNADKPVIGCKIP